MTDTTEAPLPAKWAVITAYRIAFPDSGAASDSDIISSYLPPKTAQGKLICAFARNIEKFQPELKPKTAVEALSDAIGTVVYEDTRQDRWNGSVFYASRIKAMLESEGFQIVKKEDAA